MTWCKSDQSITAEPCAGPSVVIHREDSLNATDISSESADFWSQIQFKYCHVFGVPWLIITSSGLDGWTYWRLLQSLLITINYSCSHSVCFLWLPPFSFSCRNSLTASKLTEQSQSHIATDGQSVSESWCRAPSAAHDQIFITVWQLRSCFLRGTLSDDRTGLSAAGPC
jgi:hypothetical protein